MPKRIPLGAIGVTRNGQTVYPKIGTATSGEPFDFTAEEIVEITKLEKTSGTQLLRKLMNEGPEGGEGGEVKTKALADMNLAELTAEAASREIDLGAAKTKAEIRAVIEAAEEDL